VFGHRSLILLHFGIIVEVMRSTIGRVTLLLLALGFGVVIKQIEKYQIKILTLAFLYMISLAAELNVMYANHDSPVSGSLLFIVHFPNFILNGIFWFWIYLAMRRTLNYLAMKEQMYKHSIIKKIFNSFQGCILCVLLLQVA